MKHIIATLGLISAMAVTVIAAEETKKERPERPDAGTIAKNLVSEHDADGNGSLNKEELDKGLLAMRENRPQMQRPQQGQRGPQTERPQQRQRPQTDRPQQRPEGRSPQAQRPQGQNMADMFIKRNDKDQNGELNVDELTAAFEQMGRGRAQGPQGRQRGQQGQGRPNNKG